MLFNIVFKRLKTILISYRNTLILNLIILTLDKDDQSKLAEVIGSVENKGMADW